MSGQEAVAAEENAEQVETPAEEAPEVQAAARALGWKPPSEWKGKKPDRGLMGAGDYLDKIRPQLERERERNSKLAEEFEDYKRKSGETLTKLEQSSKAALTQQRKQIEAEYAVRKEAAVEVGDKAGYRAIVKEEKEAIEEFKKSTEPTEAERKAADKPADLPKYISEAIDDFRSENPWFEKDKAMTNTAREIHEELIKEKPGLALRDNLDEVAKRIRKEFPHKFKASDKGDDEDEDEDPKPRRGSPVEGGSRMNGGSSRSQWSKVPGEAQKVARDAGHIELYLKSGETMEKNAAQARERWAAKYFEGEQ